MNTRAASATCLEPTQILTLAEGAPALLTLFGNTLSLAGDDGDDIVLAVGDCGPAVGASDATVSLQSLGAGACGTC